MYELETGFIFTFSHQLVRTITNMIQYQITDRIIYLKSFVCFKENPFLQIKSERFLLNNSYP